MVWWLAGGCLVVGWLVLAGGCLVVGWWLAGEWLVVDGCLVGYHLPCTVYQHALPFLINSFKSRLKVQGLGVLSAQCPCRSRTLQTDQVFKRAVRPRPRNWRRRLLHVMHHFLGLVLTDVRIATPPCQMRREASRQREGRLRSCLWQGRSLLVA